LALVKRSEHPGVSNPPPRPLLIWDGDCHFCALWIERWHAITGGAVDSARYQDVAKSFPQISIDQFQKSVVLIEPDGKVSFGAAAICRSLYHRRSKRWVAWSYEHVPGFALVSDVGYRMVASHRRIASLLTFLLWGKNVRPPTYFWARRWFLRLLGLIYLIAFISLWVQVDGLIGANGMSPLNQFLPLVRHHFGRNAYFLFPTLCWFNSSNAFLHFLCGAGVLCSLLLILGIAPAVSLACLFVFYLSLTVAGQVFLNFQWDILLLETGFLAIFLAPWQLWPRETATRGGHGCLPVSRAGLFLLNLLLFKLMLMSGVVKLTSGDSSWWDLTALDYHYWSQPLPTVFAWWADKSPEWFKHFSVVFCLAAEIIAPFFIWSRKHSALRLVAAGTMILLQIGIALTGNYCFFNLLTVALCLLLIDDVSIAGWARERTASEPAGLPERKPISYQISTCAAVVVIVVTLPINAWLIFSAFKPQTRPPVWLAKFYEPIEAFRIVNGYGLFRVMTKDRCEIVLEGSADGIDWQPYEFKWKPGGVKRAPGWCAPHQPRLDWQMWFAALGTPQENPWFLGLIARLLQGSDDVTRLLARNPFPDQPPRYVRAMFYRYRFTSTDEYRKTGAWWKRQELREYLPTLSLDQLRVP